MLGLVNIYLGFMIMLFGLVSILLGLVFEVYSTMYIMELLVLGLQGLNFKFLVFFDWISLIFMGVVMLISGVVMLYIGYYMKGDFFFYRFVILVYLFVVSMLLMILSPNIFSILLGWDGLGLISYCLVIYYQSSSAMNSGMITILSNRIGDVSLLFGISWASLFGNWDLMYLCAVGFVEWEIDLISYLLILAAFTKSAQVPFSAWLPAAMAAPTPVSSLVHSSTLVTAGVYLLIRFNFQVGVSLVLLVFSLLTLLMSGISALMESDMKSIIALSTLSQLGVMMFTLSLDLVEMTFFHLLSHAMFKSLLFLCAGLYIHGGADQQDTRGIGMQLYSSPQVSCYFLIASMALMGFPFMSGFYSKDLIFELFEVQAVGVGLFLMVVLGMGLTVFYSVRMIYYQVVGELGYSGGMSYADNSVMATVPMFLLLVLSVMGGSFLMYVIQPLYLINMVIWVKLLLTSMVMVVWGFLIALWGVYVYKMLIYSSVMVYGLGNMWFNYFLTVISALSVVNKSALFLSSVDQGWFECLGGQGGFSFLSSMIGFMDLKLEFNFSLFVLAMLMMIVVMAMV